MKNLFTILLFLFAFVVSSQNYKITYSFSLNIDADTIKNADRRNYYKNYFPEHAKNTFGVLWVNDKGSFFDQEGELKSISYKNNYLGKKFNFNKKHYRYAAQNIGFEHAFEFINYTDYNWQITSETKQINNYKCFKATGSLKGINGNPYYFEAWFCPEIPLSYGPDRFAGLPGLIFEVYQNDGKDLHWKLKSIQKDIDLEIKFPNFSNSLHYELANKQYYEMIKSILKH